MWLLRKCLVLLVVCIAFSKEKVIEVKCMAKINFKYFDSFKTDNYKLYL